MKQPTLVEYLTTHVSEMNNEALKNNRDMALDWIAMRYYDAEPDRVERECYALIEAIDKEIERRDQKKPSKTFAL